MSDFPWVGESIMRYNSPHSTDLSFDANQKIRVLGPAPETDDWSLGELLESGKKGIFPKEFVVRVDSIEPSPVPATTDSEMVSDSSTTPTESLPSLAEGAPKATPMAIPPKSDDAINRMPSPPPQNSPPSNSENKQGPLHALTKDIADDTVTSVRADDSAVQPVRPLSPPPPPSDISTPTPAALENVSTSLEPSHPPVHKAASPSPVPASSPPSAVKVGGMSASDAKESIKSGGSLKDRMAMFQQKAAPVASGPPPTRAKPAGNWSWKNKPPVPPPSVAEQSVAPPKTESATSNLSDVATHPSVTPQASQLGGMSASDAKESITKGGSLRERMAALQGKMGGTAPVPPPVPSGKPRVWKRPEAPSVPVSELVQPEEKKKSKWVVEEVTRDELDGSVLKSGEDLLKSNEGVEENTETSASVVTDKPSDNKEILPEQTEAEQTEPANKDDDDDDDEAAEKARRAAIAARMAKLGGRGMFAPPPPPPTPIVKEVVNDSTVTQEASTATEPSLSTPTVFAQTEDNGSDALSTAPLPAMPRRAGPPRRKPNATPKASDPIPSAPNPQEIPYPKTDEEKIDIMKKEDLAKGEHGVEGAERAGIALETSEKGEQMEDQPLISDQNKIETDNSGSTATRIGSIISEPHLSAASSTPPVDQHNNEKLSMAGVDNPSADSDEDTTDVDMVLPQRKLSIPLPDRESSVNLDEAEFRQTIQTPSAIGFVGNKEHVQGTALTGKVSGSPEQNSETGEANSDGKTEELPEDEDEDRGEDFEEPAPPPPPRSAALPPLPPKKIDLSEEEEGAQTEEEGLGHSETEEDSFFAAPPPRRTSVLPPLPPAPNLSEEETDVGASISAEEEADAEVEEDEQNGVEVEEEAPPPSPPAQISENSSLSAVSGGSVAPPPLRQRPAVPLPNVPVARPAEEITNDSNSLPSARSPISSKGSISALLNPSAPAPARAETKAIDDNTQEGNPNLSEAHTDSETARRQSIAARMAKLSGPNQFRLFGVPPVAAQKSAATTEGNEIDGPTREEGSTSNTTCTVDEEEEEEDDEVRRARARAKMAAMGGMRMGGFGMTQPASAPPPPPIEAPERPAREPIPTAHEGYTDQPHQSKMIGAHEIEDTEPIDESNDTLDRPGQESDEAILASPIAFDGENYQFDVPSFETETSAPHLSLMSLDSEEIPPPPPPGRPNRGLPLLVTDSFSGTPRPEATVRSPVSPSSVASPSSPITPNRRSSLKRVSGMFDIRKSSDGGRPILEVMEPPSMDPDYRSQTTSQINHERYEPLTSPPPPSPIPFTATSTVGDSASSSQHHTQLSNAELVQLSKNNGAQVLQVANSLLHQSKKSVVADGTSLGFVRETLYASHCQPPTEDGGSFGHLIFHQNGKSVQARRDDIRPGDIVLIEHAHFRGKKGLVHHTTDIELENGVVLEFEAKKSKVKVGQAVGKANAYPTLEAASYKLEDLQSGSIKFFRPSA